MFCRSPVILTGGQLFTGKYSDLQVLRVTVKAGTGHAVSRGTTVKGWCCSWRECCAVGDGSRESSAAKTYHVTRCQTAPQKNDGFLKKVHKGLGGGFAGEYFFKHELIHCTVFMFMSQRRTTLQMVQPISNRCLQRTGRKLQTSITTYSSNCTTNIHTNMETSKFDVHMPVHRKYISTVQPTRCNVFSIYLLL